MISQCIQCEIPKKIKDIFKQDNVNFGLLIDSILNCSPHYICEKRGKQARQSEEADSVNEKNMRRF